MMKILAITVVYALVLSLISAASNNNGLILLGASFILGIPYALVLKKIDKNNRQSGS